MRAEAQAIIGRVASGDLSALDDGRALIARAEAAGREAVEALRNLSGGDIAFRDDDAVCTTVDLVAGIAELAMLIDDATEPGNYCPGGVSADLAAAWRVVRAHARASA